MIPTLAIKIPRQTKPPTQSEDSTNITDDKDDDQMVDVDIQDDIETENKATLPEEDEHPTRADIQRPSTKSKAIKVYTSVITHSYIHNYSL